MTMFGIKASGRVIATDLEQENAGCCTLMTNPLAILTVRISVCSRSRFAPVAAEVSPRHHSVKTTQRPVAALSKESRSSKRACNAHPSEPALLIQASLQCSSKRACNAPPSEPAMLIQASLQCSSKRACNAPPSEPAMLIQASLQCSSKRACNAPPSEPAMLIQASLQCSSKRACNAHPSEPAMLLQASLQCSSKRACNAHPSEPAMLIQASLQCSSKRACNAHPSEPAMLIQASLQCSSKRACNAPPSEPAMLLQASLQCSSKRACNAPPSEPAMLIQASLHCSSKRACNAPPSEPAKARTMFVNVQSDSHPSSSSRWRGSRSDKLHSKSTADSLLSKPSLPPFVPLFCSSHSSVCIQSALSPFAASAQRRAAVGLLTGRTRRGPVPFYQTSAYQLLSLAK
ncbi:hypothetical protein BLNAU_24874 [Blattamonas nauphoetae]|uniref:Uncharacterized protein n=1 Tax=Blattamonas nauphoetae TaxID=2049346 RepID=A0ABQ9WL84_9EUKA|nr:hypothetical protein BLNAU_24874 [Blattamonas nauphoetae]